MEELLYHTPLFQQFVGLVASSCRLPNVGTPLLTLPSVGGAQTNTDHGARMIASASRAMACEPAACHLLSEIIRTTERLPLLTRAFSGSASVGTAVATKLQVPES